MAEKVICNSDDLTAVANAIRSKTGETGGMTVGAMAGKVAGIEVGGGSDSGDGLSVVWENLTAGQYQERNTRAVTPQITMRWKVPSDTVGFIACVDGVYYSYSINGSTITKPTSTNEDVAFNSITEGDGCLYVVGTQKYTSPLHEVYGLAIPAKS